MSNVVAEANELTAKIFENSTDIINNKFGEDYAKKNPNLLASIVTLQERIYSQLNHKQ